jgi:hypothetical protein
MSAAPCRALPAGKLARLEVTGGISIAELKIVKSRNSVVTVASAAATAAVLFMPKIFMVARKRIAPTAANFPAAGKTYSSKTKATAAIDPIFPITNDRPATNEIESDT